MKRKLVFEIYYRFVYRASSITNYRSLLFICLGIFFGEGAFNASVFHEYIKRKGHVR